MLVNAPSVWQGWSQTQRDQGALDAFPDTADFDLQDFRTRASEIVEFLGRDYQAIRGHAEDLFEEQTFPLRYVPLVWKYARQMAPMYVRAPTRTISGVTAGSRRRLEDVYQRGGFDLFMRTTSRMAVCTNSCVVSCDPAPPSSVAWRLWAPHEVQVEFEDPLEEDIRRARRVDLRVPIGVENGKITFGRRVYTQSEAYLTDIAGKKRIRGLFRPDGGNPYSAIPLRAYRRDPEIVHKGIWFPEIQEDLRSLQIGVCVVLSFVEHIGRHQGFTQRSLVGPGAKQAAENMYTGPDYLLALPGDDLSLNTHDPNPPTDKTLAALETTLRLWGAANYVDVETLLSHSSGITGDAKAIELQDQDEAREELQADMARLENDLAGLTLEVLGGVGLARDESGRPIVEMEYHYAEPKRNALQTAQALEARYALLLDDPIRTIAKERGISKEKAKQVFRETTESLIELRKAQLEVGGGSPDPMPDNDGDNNVPEIGEPT